jgi:hypothetical protein
MQAKWRQSRSAIRALGITTLVLLAWSLAYGSSLKFQWRNANYKGGSFKNILVLAINGSAAARADFEDRMAQELNRPGLAVTQSYTLMPRPDATPINMNDLRGYVQDNKFDAVVASRIVKLDQTWKEVDPGDFPFYPYYGTFYGYYAAVAPVVYDPSYLEKETDVQVETNWYAIVAPESQLVWSGTTDTKNPRSEPKAVNSIVKVLMEAIEEQRLIPGKTKEAER